MNADAIVGAVGRALIAGGCLIMAGSFLFGLGIAWMLKVSGVW